MGFLSLAISIGRDIERVGSLAGYAAILGLAILSLLYFAQSREVKRLREWAGRAPERDAELQQRVAEDAARRAAGGTAAPVAPAAAPRPAGASVPATAAAQAAAKPAAPPKPAAPGQPPKPAIPAAPATTAQPATPGQPPKPATPATPGSPGPAPGAPPAAGTPKPVVPPPVPGKGPATPAPATAAAAGAAAARPRRTVTVGSTPSSATVPVRENRDGGGSGLSTRAILAGVLGVALVVVVLLVSGVLGGGDDPSGAQATTATTTTTDAGAAIPAPGDTSVAVLNGTTITGLARNAADDLEEGDYSVIRVTDAADQAQQVSQVAYSEGFEGSARRIARIVGIDAANILPLDASTRVVAGEDASVVVTMGADKAQ